MLRPIQSLCWILLFFTTGLVEAAKKIPSPKEIARTPTQIEAITRWRDLPGGNYVMGYGPHPVDTEKEVALAVYDKTFRSLLSPGFMKKSWLFAFGYESRGLSNMARELRRSHKKTGAIVEETFEEFIDELQSTKTTIVFKKIFWKDSYWKWKPDRKPDSSGPDPEVIYLDDIDVAAMMHNSKSFNKVKRKLPLVVSSQLTEEDTDDIVSALQEAKLVRLPSGEYCYEGGDIEMASPPVKIIDIMGKYSSYRWALKYAVSAMVLKSAINAIPFYGPPQAAIFMMERVFNLIEAVYLIRHGMAISLALEALEGNTRSPFYGQLTQQELEDAVSYLLLSRTMISSLIINATGQEKVFYHFWKFAQEKKQECLKALKKRGVEVFPLANSFYAVGKKNRKDGKKSIKVYSLLKTKVFRPGKPINVVDFDHSRAEYRTRNAMEGLLAGMSFIATPVVNVGSALKLIYKEGFIREVHRRQMQEGGFRSLLLHHPQDFFDALSQAGYDTPEERQIYYMRALGIVEDREINPFDLKAVEHAHWRKKVENWISKKDPAYIPEPFVLATLLQEEAKSTEGKDLQTVGFEMEESAPDERPLKEAS